MRITRSSKATATGLVAAAALSVAASTAVASPTPTARSAATSTVLVKDNFFSPKSMSVAKNTTLKFVWRGRLVHNVAVGRKIVLANRTKGTGAIRVTRSVVFNCTLHRGMNLAVRVR